MELGGQAEALLKSDPVDDDEVVRLKEGIEEAEERSTEYEQVRFDRIAVRMEHGEVGFWQFTLGTNGACMGVI